MPTEPPRWASRKAAKQNGICPICRQEMVDIYGDDDVPEHDLMTEHHKAKSDTYRLLGICRDHAQLIMIRLWRFLPQVAEDE